MPLRYTLRQLEYLVAVGDAGTIAQAAQSINVSSPSISSAISQLEAEFGIQIFVRHHAQGLSLTPGGRRVYNEAKRILASTAGLRDMAREIAEKARGPITIGALNSIAPLLSAGIRRSFEAEYPDANVTLREGHQAHLLDMLNTAEIDAALTYELEIPTEVSFEPLISLPPFVMLPADHALTEQPDVSLDQLETQPMILLDLPLSREYFLSMFTNAGLRPNISERTTDLSVARSLVANGFGFSLVNLRPKSEAAPDGEHFVFRPVRDDIRPLTLGLAMRQTDHRPKVLTAFVEHVTTLIKTKGLPGTLS